MDQLSNTITDIFQWIKADFQTWPTRFILEVVAWAMSIACSAIMAVTLPHPPFLLLYPMFIAQCGIFAWSAWSRQSFGLLANYVLLMTIDVMALTRLILM